MRLDFYTPSGGRSTGPSDVPNVNRPSGIYDSGAPHGSHREDAPLAWSKQPQAHLSPMGLLMRELHTLKGENPDAFAAATASIATNLRQLADAETGDAAERLNTVADRFELASDNGDLSALRPQPQTFGKPLRGPSAYLQHAGDIQETRVEIRAVIRDVLDQFSSDPNPSSAVSDNPAETPTHAPGQADDTPLEVAIEGAPNASTTNVGQT